MSNNGIFPSRRNSPSKWFNTLSRSAVAHSFFDVHPFADTSSSNNAIAEYHEPGSTFEDVSLDEDLDSGFEDLA